MLVESDVNLRQSIALILQRVDFRITATDCDTKALELLKLGDYHMLIADIGLPETINTLLTKAATLYPQLPILILTDESIGEIERLKRCSNAHFLIKPVAPEQLLECVRSILGKTNSSDHFNIHIASHP